MRDHHQRGDGSPLYGTGPGHPYPPLAGDPYASVPDPYGTRSPDPYGTQHLPAYPPGGSEGYGSGAPQLEQQPDLVACPCCGTGVHPDRLADFQARRGVAEAEADRGRPVPQEGVDLTAWDHLVENTPKDAPYGGDSDLPAAPQGWTAR